MRINDLRFVIFSLALGYVTYDSPYLGRFSSKTRCWLALWELGIVVELPVGCFIFFPSALFHHWNIDSRGDLAFPCSNDKTWLIQVLECPCLFTTENNERFGQDNVTPLSEHPDYRFSLVWFNQASMFQTAEQGTPTTDPTKASGPPPPDDFTQRAPEIFPNYYD